MKNQFFLKQLVSNVTRSLRPMAVNRYSFFINDISADINLSVNQDILGSVVSELLQTAVNQTHNDCIRISAVIEDKMVLLNIHENGYCSPVEMTQSLQLLQSLLASIGGSVAITDHHTSGHNLAVRFFNN